MQVRRISEKEKLDAYLISAYCFHQRIENVEAKREEIEKDTSEDWGAFTEDGVLAARIINNHFQFMLDGESVCGGGIGAVSTLPEYRELGAIRQIFKRILKKAYERGEVLSALYPFQQAFYRKQGYEVVTFESKYEFAPEVVKGYHFDGEVVRWTPGESVEPYVKIYSEFSKNFNMSIPRDEKSMLRHMNVENLYMDRKFSYLFRKNGEEIAYLIFKDVKDKPAATLHVEECAWMNGAGFEAILAFLGRFTADYGKIQLPLPAGIDLLRIIRSPRSYDIQKTSRHDFMVRPICAEKLLEKIAKLKDCDFIIQVTDELIEENNGCFRVTNHDVKKVENITPDICVSEKVLGQMAVGTINLDEAMLKPDVKVLGKEEMLRLVFREKKILLSEYF